MHRRAGRRLQELARERRWHAVRANRLAIVTVVTVFTICAIGVVVLVAFWKGRDNAYFAAGAATMSVGFVAWLAMENLQARRLFDAADAERFTAGAVRRLRRRGWGCVDHVEFDRFDIDHVVAGPGGVFAVETKWTNEPWRITDGAFDNSYARKAVGQCRDGAARISSLLWGNYRIRCDVAPLLVIWGPGRPVADAPVRMDGVLVMPGQLLRRTLSSRQAAMENMTAEAVIDAIEDFTRRRDQHDASRQPAVVRHAM